MFHKLGRAVVMNKKLLFSLLGALLMMMGGIYSIGGPSIVPVTHTIATSASSGACLITPSHNGVTAQPLQCYCLIIQILPYCLIENMSIQSRVKMRFLFVVGHPAALQWLSMH